MIHSYNLINNMRKSGSCSTINIRYIKSFILLTKTKLSNQEIFLICRYKMIFKTLIGNKGEYLKMEGTLLSSMFLNNKKKLTKLVFICMILIEQ